jgi:opacity protein-like surface antigen
MKRLATLAMSLLAVSAFAETPTETTSTTDTTTAQAATVNEGIRVNLRRGSADTEVKMKMSFLGQSFSDKDSENYDITEVSGGYERILVQKIGFYGEGSYSLISGSDGDLRSIGAEAGATYGINDKAYVMAGYRIARLSADLDSNDEGAKAAEDAFDDLDLGRGIQVTGGYKLNDRVKLELKYSTMQYEGESTIKDNGLEADLDLTVTTSTLMIGASATF